MTGRFCTICAVEIEQDQCTSRYNEVLLPLAEYVGQEFAVCVTRLQAGGCVPLGGSWQEVRLLQNMPVEASQKLVLPGEYAKVSRLFRYHTSCYMRSCELTAEAALRSLFDSAGRPLGMLMPPSTQLGALTVTVSLKGTLRVGQALRIANQLEIAALWKEWSMGNYRQPALGFSLLEILDPYSPQRSYRMEFTNPHDSGKWLQEMVSDWRLPLPRRH